MDLLSRSAGVVMGRDTRNRNTSLMVYVHMVYEILESLFKYIYEFNVIGGLDPGTSHALGGVTVCYQSHWL